MNEAIHSFRHLCWIIALSVMTASPSAIGDDPESSLDSISANSLRGNLSFIASDFLEGRDTPSRGLDIAAEYIAAQFRKAGLEPVGDDDYFQTSSVESDDPATGDFACSVRGEHGSLSLPATRLTVLAARDDISIENAPLLSIPFPLPEKGIEVFSDASCVIVTRMPPYQSLPRDAMRAYFQDLTRFMQQATELNAAAILTVDANSETGTGPGVVGRLGRMATIPIITIHGKELPALIGLDHDASTRKLAPVITMHYQLPNKRSVPVRNVVGLLPGRDPDLSSEYILVTGHYDHIGRGSPVDGDDIYNGANDDGSGTVSVIEVASALARLENRPRRSILFMCVYGEERGLLGSRHYVENPIVPLEKTVANVNLEHFGRTDDSDGERINRIMPTGYGYSTMLEPFVRAGELEGIEIYHHPQNSASFFGRSDNVAFASKGIPAHSFCTAFIFPDYHGAGDHWNKIDYENMARCCRVVARGLIALANQDSAPVWNEDARGVRRYVDAWKKLHSADQESLESDGD